MTTVVPEEGNSSKDASGDGTRASAYSELTCGSLTFVLSTNAFSIVCEFFGSSEDYAALCRVCRRIRADAMFHCSHIEVDILSTRPYPFRLVRSAVVNNIALWHYGREDFQDGLILFLPPPGAPEIDPQSHHVLQHHKDVRAESLSLRNTVEVDYDSNGMQQKFRFSTAWLPTPRAIYNYFEHITVLELQDFYNGLDWYMSFLDPVIMGTLSPRSGSATAPSTPNSTFSDSTDWTPSMQWTPPLPLRPLNPSEHPPLVDLAELRLSNCRTSIEEVKLVVQTSRAAQKIVVTESYRSNHEFYSVESSPRRRIRPSRRRMRSVSPDVGIASCGFTTVIDLHRCTTQQLEDILGCGLALRRVIVRCLVVMEQSSLETACHQRLHSLSLHCAPESSVREGSIEICLEAFPALLEFGLYDGPLTGLGATAGSRLEVLHLENCQVDIREQLLLPYALATVRGCRLFSALHLKGRRLLEESIVSGELVWTSSMDPPIEGEGDDSVEPAEC